MPPQNPRQLEQTPRASPGAAGILRTARVPNRSKETLAEDTAAALRRPPHSAERYKPLPALPRERGILCEDLPRVPPCLWCPLRPSVVELLSSAGNQKALRRPAAS